MKGKINGSPDYEISITATGLLKITDTSQSKTILMNPAQAKALSEFIKDAEPVMEKSFIGASWGI